MNTSNGILNANDMNSTDNITITNSTTSNSPKYSNNNTDQHTYLTMTTNDRTSDMIGFVLFIFGLSILVLFLSVLSKKQQAYNVTRHPISGTSITNTSANNDSHENPPIAGYELYTSMTVKERRQYIDTVLQINYNSYVRPPLNDGVNSDIGKLHDTDIESLCAITLGSKNHNGNEENSADDSISSKCSTSTLYHTSCCVICLEPFHNNNKNSHTHDEISRSIDPNCHHEYHKSCITEWLMKHPDCPYCRRLYIPLPSKIINTTMTTTTTTTRTVDLETRPSTALSLSNSERPSSLNQEIITSHQPDIISEQQQQPIRSCNALLRCLYSIVLDVTHDWRQPTRMPT